MLLGSFAILDSTLVEHHQCYIAKRHNLAHQIVYVCHGNNIQDTLQNIGVGIHIHGTRRYQRDLVPAISQIVDSGKAD